MMSDGSSTLQPAVVRGAHEADGFAAELSWIGWSSARHFLYPLLLGSLLPSLYQSTQP
jgi:hypothetical protein